jgi:predicted transcriptional regulator
MFASEMMSKCVAECTEDTGLETVYELLRKCEHGLVVVVDSEAHRVPIGVVSERSICEQIIARGRNPRTLSAGSVLDSRIRTIREMDQLDKLNVSENEHLAAVVVVNDRRQACGIITKETLRGIPTPAFSTRSTSVVVVNTNPRQSPAVSEIPAFGWIQ